MRVKVVQERLERLASCCCSANGRHHVLFALALVNFLDLLLHLGRVQSLLARVTPFLSVLCGSGWRWRLRKPHDQFEKFAAVRSVAILEKVDGLLEFRVRRELDIRKSNKEMLGTTKKGIGPCYSSKASRSGLRICDLVASDFENRFVEKFKRLASDHERAYGTQVDVQAEVSKYKELAKKIKPYVTETVSYMHKVLDAGEKVLVEGANASMLDIDFGTYPYVTSSNCSIGGVCTGLGLPPGRIGKVFGVVKAYTTRVGAGAFPTELDNELGQYLQKHGAEFGVTTGRKRRCGWLDLAMLKFTHCLNNFTALALTKLDILSDLDEIKIGVNYLKEGSRPMIHYPSSEQDFEDVSVDYVTLPGWKCDITQCKRFEELPSRAQDYVTTIESIVNVPIWWIGVGQSREAMIERGPPSSVF